MTDQTETPNAETPPEGTETDAPKGNKEARYRTERNQYREQVATLTARVEQFQRLDIERVAAESLSAPVDLWMNGNDVSAYLDDAGNVDIERVREDVKLLVSERPGLGKYQPAVDYSQGSGNVAPMPGKTTPTFGDLLKS